MTINGLAFIHACLAEMKIPYNFVEWTATPVPSTYWVGEYTETEPMNEDGQEQSTFILTGTTNKKYYDLEVTKNKIKDYFKYTKTAILEDGSGIAVSFSDATPIPSVESGVKRMQINLKIKEWSV